jgi:hypothetical protein
LQRFVLRTLVRKLSLGLCALVLDLLRLLGALVLDLLLASILLRGELESEGGKHERNYEQLCRKPQTVFPRKPGHLGQAIPRLDGGSSFRTNFFCSTERSSSHTFRPHHSQHR